MNGIVAREDFVNAVRIFENAFPEMARRGTIIDDFKITQAELRLEQLLSAGNTLYTFPIIDGLTGGGAGQFNTEIRLRQQDTFVPVAARVCLANPTSSTDTTFDLHTYANQFLFTNAVQMNAIYNGQMRIQVNNVQYSYNWGLQRHKYVPETQQTAAFGAGSPVDEFDGATYGYFPMQPFILFGGAQNVTLQIVLPVAPTAVDAFSRLVIQFLGVQAQNSTPVS